MPRIDASFLVLATLCLIVGVVMGIVMGVQHDFQLAPVHAHLNLVGWTSLALFGLVYKAYPAMRRSRLAAAHFALSSASAVLFPAGIYLSIAHQFPAVAIAGAFMWLAGVLVFLVHFVRTQLADASAGRVAGRASWAGLPLEESASVG